MATYVERDVRQITQVRDLLLFQCFVRPRVHRGDMPRCTSGDNIGTEVDLLLEDGTSLRGVEIKSGQTLVGDLVRSLQTWHSHTAAVGAWPVALVYGGTVGFQRWGVQGVGWRELAAVE